MSLSKINSENFISFFHYCKGSIKAVVLFLVVYLYAIDLASFKIIIWHVRNICKKFNLFHDESDAIWVIDFTQSIQSQSVLVPCKY